MTDVANLEAVDVIRRQMGAALKTQLDGSFAVIRYPPGFNFNTQYGNAAYHNPHTFELLDQLCKTSGDGTASLTGSSFSNKFGAIMRTVDYVISTADAAANKKALADFKSQTALVIQEFETSFGKITDAQITASGSLPATKTGYILAFLKKNFPGDQPSLGWAYASLEAAYADWQRIGVQIERTSAGPRDAINTVSAAQQAANYPNAANGGFQTSPTTWAVGYTGLPTAGAISTSLQDVSRTATVNFILQDIPPLMAAQKIHTKNAPTKPPQEAVLPIASLKLRVVQTGAIQPRTLAAPMSALKTAPAKPPDDPWKSATKITMQIVYVGLTILRADPVELSSDLKTGWFTRQILTDVAHKTGQDVTGLQLRGSSFSADELFGQGKTFARVRTFVISQEPTVKLTFFGTSLSGLTSHFKINQKAELDLGSLISLGRGSGDFNVTDVTTAQGSVTITLAPPTQTVTIPAVDQTAHIIGGVIDFPK